jgi:hypothetical protein
MVMALGYIFYVSISKDLPNVVKCLFCFKE